MTPELEVVVDLLFELDTPDSRGLTRDDVLPWFAAVPSRRDQLLLSMLETNDPRVPGVLSVWARSCGWVELADHLLGGPKSPGVGLLAMTEPLWPRRFQVYA